MLHAAVKSVLFVALAQIAAGAAGTAAGAAFTVTLTVCVATPWLLLAVKLKLIDPTSLVGGV